MTQKEELQKALDKTIEAYKALLKNPEKEFTNWMSYGTFRSCRFCAVLSVQTDNNLIHCKECPLWTINDFKVPCITETVSNLCVSIHKVKYFPTEDYFEKLKIAAKNRLEYIKEIAEINGFKIEE